MNDAVDAENIEEAKEGGKLLEVLREELLGLISDGSIDQIERSCTFASTDTGDLDSGFIGFVEFYPKNRDEHVEVWANIGRNEFESISRDDVVFQISIRLGEHVFSQREMVSYDAAATARLIECFLTTKTSFIKARKFGMFEKRNASFLCDGKTIQFPVAIRLKAST